MNAFEAPLRDGLAGLGLALQEDQVSKLLEYLDLIQKWNKVYNLTAVRDPADMLTHHLLDSLAIIHPLKRQTRGEPIRLLDVGSGAGLPGVVIALCCPEIQVDCVDTVAKKAAFVQQVAVALQLPNLRGVHHRVEKLGRSLPGDCLAGLRLAARFRGLVLRGAGRAGRMDGDEGQASR